jgi:hypothetical protein
MDEESDASTHNLHRIQLDPADPTLLVDLFPISIYATRARQSSQRMTYNDLQILSHIPLDEPSDTVLPKTGDLLQSESLMHVEELTPCELKEMDLLTDGVEESVVLGEEVMVETL